MGVRRACRVDENQRGLVAFWRQLGATVLILSEIGHGCPDLLVGFRGKNFLVEVKDGKKIPSKQKLTPRESEFHKLWRGQICVIKNQDEAFNLFNSI